MKSLLARLIGRYLWGRKFLGGCWEYRERTGWMQLPSNLVGDPVMEKCWGVPELVEEWL